MKKTKCSTRDKCPYGEKCRYLKKTGGCRKWHPLHERKLGRNQRKRIKKKRKLNVHKVQKTVIQPAVSAQPVAAQPQTQVVQVVVRPLWRTFHRGCDDCSHEGCSKCHYRTVCGKEIITAPGASRLPREIACRRCGAVGDSDDLYCLKCGY